MPLNTSRMSPKIMQKEIAPIPTHKKPQLVVSPLKQFCEGLAGKAKWGIFLAPLKAKVL